MKSKKMWMLVALMLLVSVQGVLADGLSVQLKRTNPGMAGDKSGELIFDIVNMDVGNEIEGFLLCRSPDDVTISSTLGVGSGSGAQYVSPKFDMNSGPSQRSMSIVVDSETVGDMKTGCILKYIPYAVSTVKKTEIFDNNTNQTVVSMETKRIYQKMNGETIETVEDKDYRELRLDKTIPFVEKKVAADVSCPEGQTNCKASEVQTSYGGNWYFYGCIALGLVLLLSGAYIFGRSARSY